MEDGYGPQKVFLRQISPLRVLPFAGSYSICNSSSWTVHFNWLIEHWEMPVFCTTLICNLLQQVTVLLTRSPVSRPTSSSSTDPGCFSASKPLIMYTARVYCKSSKQVTKGSGKYWARSNRWWCTCQRAQEVSRFMGLIISQFLISISDGANKLVTQQHEMHWWKNSPTEAICRMQSSCLQNKNLWPSSTFFNDHPRLHWYALWIKNYMGAILLGWLMQ